MKKFLLLFILSVFSFAVYAQETSPADQSQNSDSTSISETESEADGLNLDLNSDEKPKRETIFSNTKIFFSQGFSFVQATRIQKQHTSSNFVWKDVMVGAYSAVQSEGFPLSDWYFRYQILYPFKHQFNGMEMFPKQTILYAFDFFFGMPFQFKSYKYVNINLTPGLHGMYQLTDEYHLGYFGAGVIAGFEFPITQRWTVIYDGTFNLDYPNLGSNKLMQPFDLSWQWQTSIGFRYSKRKTNSYSYVNKYADAE